MNNPENDIKQVRRLIMEGVVTHEEIRNAPIVELPSAEEVWQKFSQILNELEKFLPIMVSAFDATKNLDEESRPPYESAETDAMEAFFMLRMSLSDSRNQIELPRNSQIDASQFVSSTHSQRPTEPPDSRKVRQQFTEIADLLQEELHRATYEAYQMLNQLAQEIKPCQLTKADAQRSLLTLWEILVKTRNDIKVPLKNEKPP